MRLLKCKETAAIATLVKICKLPIFWYNNLPDQYDDREPVTCPTAKDQWASCFIKDCLGTEVTKTDCPLHKL